MAIIESYLFLFFDSILACLIMMPNTSMVYKSMLIFNKWNIYIITIISIIGNYVGCSLNYLIGYTLNSVRKKISNESEKFSNLVLFVNTHLIFLPLFSFISLIGVLITTSSGFFKINYFKYSLYIILGRAAYHLYLIWLL